MEKRKPGRPYVPALITLDEGVAHIRTYLSGKYQNISDLALDKLCLSKKTLYNYRSSGRLTAHKSRCKAMVDARELERLV